MRITEDIVSLTDFKRNTAAHLDRMNKHHRPLVLTVNGKARFVVQAAESYERLRDTIDRHRTIEAIRRGLEDVEAGRTMTLEEAERRLEKKYGSLRRKAG